MDSSKTIALSAAPLTEADARTVCAWRYEDEYGVYNIPSWEMVAAQHWGIADEQIRRHEFYSLRNEQGALVGFFRLHVQDDFVLLSLGLAPEYCGKGLGNAAMALILAEAERKAPGKQPELEVRTFNRRAIACYVRCGFETIDAYHKEMPTGADTFVRMGLRTHGHSS